MTDVANPPSSELVTGNDRAADEKHCFSCGRIMHASSAACPSCGAVQPAGTWPAAAAQGLAQSVYCYGCGAPIHPSASACPKCGAPQPGNNFVRSSKSRVTAAVLAFLLGGIGVHKFYLGQTGWGILYLLFCWTFVPGVVALIEGFILLAELDADFNRNYG